MEGGIAGSQAGRGGFTCECQDDKCCNAVASSTSTHKCSPKKEQNGVASDPHVWLIGCVRYSDGIKTEDPVDSSETCFLGPKCCEVAGIPNPAWGTATGFDAEAITFQLLDSATAALVEKHASLHDETL